MKKLTVHNYRDDKYYPRVLKAIANILDKSDVVAPVEVFMEMSLLTRKQYEDWRFGRIACLERVIQGNLGKVGRILRLIGFCAHDLDMVPSRTVYNKWGRGASQHLCFSKSGEKAIEEAYERHFLWNKSAAKKLVMIMETRRSMCGPDRQTLPANLSSCVQEITRILKTRIPAAKDSWAFILTSQKYEAIHQKTAARLEELIAAYLSLLTNAQKLQLWGEAQTQHAGHEQFGGMSVCNVEKGPEDGVEEGLPKALMAEVLLRAKGSANGKKPSAHCESAVVNDNLQKEIL